MRINPEKAGGTRIFRTWGWPVLVISQELKQVMEAARLTGPRFTEV